MQRKSHLECIAGNSGHQSTVIVEDLLQISSAWSASFAANLCEHHCLHSDYSWKHCFLAKGGGEGLLSACPGDEGTHLAGVSVVHYRRVLKPKADCSQISMLCIQSGAVFTQPAAAIAHKAAGERSTRRSLLSKVQRQVQCKTAHEHVGVEGMTPFITLPD